jgi:hypothetical protein
LWIQLPLLSRLAPFKDVGSREHVDHVVLRVGFGGTSLCDLEDGLGLDEDVFSVLAGLVALWWAKEEGWRWESQMKKKEGDEGLRCRLTRKVESERRSAQDTAT